MLVLGTAAEDNVEQKEEASKDGTNANGDVERGKVPKFPLLEQSMVRVVDGVV